MKKVKRYIIAFDADGDSVVWFQYADYSVRLSSMNPIDIEDSDTPVIDLRNPAPRS